MGLERRGSLRWWGPTGGEGTAGGGRLSLADDGDGLPPPPTRNVRAGVLTMPSDAAPLSLAGRPIGSGGSIASDGGE